MWHGGRVARGASWGLGVRVMAGGAGTPFDPAHLWIPAFAGTTVGVGGWWGGGWELGAGTAPRRAPALGSRFRGNDGGGERIWGGARVMGWGDALGGDAPRAAPLLIPAFAGMTREGAGMTREGAGMTIFAGMTIGGVGDGERCWGVGALRQAQGERGWEARVRWGGGMRWGETPHAAPLWIPAFAGMTGGCRGRRGLLVGGGPSTGSGRTDLGGARAMGCGGCDEGRRRPAPRPSGFLPSQE